MNIGGFIVFFYFNIIFIIITDIGSDYVGILQENAERLAVRVGRIAGGYAYARLQMRQRVQSLAVFYINIHNIAIGGDICIYV